MLVLSHRGYHVNHPENSLDAFGAAIAMGVDGIETDIRLTADGVPILYHDHLAPDGRPIEDLKHADLESLVKFPVPTVGQALDLPVPDPQNFLWNLEIKTPAAIEQTMAAVKDYAMRRRMLITSFWHPLIAEISRRAEVECGLLVCHRPVDMTARPDWVPTHSRVTSIVWYWEFADPALIAQSAACGFRNFVYGATTRAEHARLAVWKLDGVITDRPEYLREPAVPL